jgi:hypothetical protein
MRGENKIIARVIKRQSRDIRFVIYSRHAQVSSLVARTSLRKYPTEEWFWREVKRFRRGSDQGTQDFPRQHQKLQPMSLQPIAFRADREFARTREGIKAGKWSRVTTDWAFELLFATVQDPEKR